jgi:hypothetical protein
VPAVSPAPATHRIRPLTVLTAVLVTVGLLAFVPLVRESAPYTAPTLTTVALLRFARVREAMLASVRTVPMALAVTLWLRVGDGVPTAELSRFSVMSLPGQGTNVQLDFPVAPAPLPALTADA